MKNIKKFLSLLLVLAMVFAMSSAVFAASPSDDATVTVYVTKGMFDEGGFDRQNNTYAKVQKYLGGNPAAHLNGTFTDMEPVELDVATIKAVMDRTIYAAPSTLSADPNVLDAIIVAFNFYGYDNIQGGWDSNPVEGEPGGYINSVYPETPSYGPGMKETIDGVEYDVYTGSGWNIACTQNGVVKEIESYGSNFVLEDGMVIVFDFSPYRLYYPSANN